MDDLSVKPFLVGSKSPGRLYVVGGFLRLTFGVFLL